MCRSRNVLSIVAGMLLALSVMGQQDSIVMQAYESGDWRWLDVADQEYAGSYQETYSYADASVIVSYDTVAEQLFLTLQGSNLKPNFAYQVKLVGTPGTTSNERIGLTGRWWQQTWDSDLDMWSNGTNLNSKGDGSSPNPNDLVYEERKDDPDPDSPTGLHYRFTGYRLFAYFITDEAGEINRSFRVDSSYHVLWANDWIARQEDDGPLVTHTFDPYPDSDPAYDDDWPENTRSIYGEWERLPTGGIDLLEGDYQCQIVFTEESFHGSGLAGNWAGAMYGNLEFTIVAEGTLSPNLTVSGHGQTIVSGDDEPDPGDYTDFGKLDVNGGWRTHDFVLSNTGTGNLHISEISIGGEHADDFFAESPAPLILAPEQAIALSVTFNPSGKGRRNAELRVVSDDPDTPTYSFSIRGRGKRNQIIIESDSSGCRMGPVKSSFSWLLFPVLALLFIRFRDLPAGRRDASVMMPVTAAARAPSANNPPVGGQRRFRHRP